MFNLCNGLDAFFFGLFVIAVDMCVYTRHDHFVSCDISGGLLWLSSSNKGLTQMLAMLNEEEVEVAQDGLKYPTPKHICKSHSIPF